MFLNLDQNPQDSLAVVDDLGYQLTYGDLCAFTDDFFSQINKRTLIFILCDNCAAAMAGYIACLSSRITPLLLSRNIDKQLLDNMIMIYQPEFIWAPDSMVSQFCYKPVYSNYGYTLIETNQECHELYDGLALLMTTSGSTGSPKVVRHSYNNVESIAKNVAKVFEMDEKESGMISLPIHFTQGLNVATSHLYGGSVILLPTATIMQKRFWEFLKNRGATSITAVPYTIELLNKLRFFEMDLPCLKTLNQGGGRLTDELFMKCAEYATRTGRRFIPTYGSTETTSRMAYLPPELTMEKCGSIGRAIPEGVLTLVDDDGQEISENEVLGEIVYQGPNVMLGYAESGFDLAKGDEQMGVYATGDLAWFDGDGCHFIVGRKKRFLKLFGNRIGLDEVERLIKENFLTECACTGTDNNMIIYVTDNTKKSEISKFLEQITGINKTAFTVETIGEIPKNDAKKILYENLPKQL